MHIPDGFLDPIWVVVTYALSIVALGLASRRAKQDMEERSYIIIPLFSAAVFVAQMLNWPIPGGTSLHFLGGALLGIMLGPYLGMLSMAFVIVVQCLLFHDGGITTLGANLLNMSVIPVLIGYYVFVVLNRTVSKIKRSTFIPALIAGWLSVVIAGIACGIEIGLSPNFPYGINITLPIMGGWHAILGIVEGLITGLIVSHIYKRHSLVT